MKEYRENNKEICYKSIAKRNRELDFIPVFPVVVNDDYVYHHINNLFVYPIPEISHKYCYAGSNRSLHRSRCNALIEHFFCVDMSSGESFLFPKF